jgi:archaellum component FlaC
METQTIITMILGICGIIGFALTFADKLIKKGKNEISLDDRVNDLERHYAEISNELEKIKNNHLAHIKDDINGIQKDVVEIKTILKIKLQ